MKRNEMRALTIVLLVAGFGLIPRDLPGESITGRIVTAAVKTGEPGSTTVIWIEGTGSAPVPDIDTEIIHAGGRLIPPVSIGYVGGEFVLRNDDTKFHNTHLYLHLNYQEEASQRPLHYGATLYNIPQPQQGVEIRKPIKPYHRYREETGFIEAVCNPHPQEKAFVLVFDHPYCAIAEGNSSFTIEGVPPGKYPLMAFHDGTIRQVTTVEVREGDQAPIVIDLAAWGQPSP